ncbi:hypothetical protein AB4Y36_36480 [Paraburkholderia sp. BR10936]|uniref:hypothetical protein n=1 Tax=Paraburkholderia sp. BR10936 TaxID=3236993 RepID=UPI0034D32549
MLFTRGVQMEVNGHLSCYAELFHRQGLQSVVAIVVRFSGDVARRAVRTALTAPMTASAHLKRILKLDRLRLRGPSGAHDEFLLAATAQNLRRMAKWLTPTSQTAVRMIA